MSSAPILNLLGLTVSESIGVTQEDRIRGPLIYMQILFSEMFFLNISIYVLALLYFTLILPAFSLGKNGLGERLRETLSCPVVQSSGPSGKGGGLCFGIGGLEFVVNDILRSLDVLPNAILFFLSFPKVNSDLFSKSAHRQEKCARR